MLFAWSNYDWTAASHGNLTTTDFASSYFRFVTGNNACAEAVDNSTVTSGDFDVGLFLAGGQRIGLLLVGHLDGTTSTSWAGTAIDASEWTASAWFRLDALPATSTVVWQLGDNPAAFSRRDSPSGMEWQALTDVSVMQDLWYHVVVRNGSAGLTVDVSHTAIRLGGG